MKKKAFIIIAFLGISIQISNSQIMEGGMALLNISGSKGILSGITSKISGFLGTGGGTKIDQNLIQKLQRIEKLMENSLCLMREVEFTANYYASSNSCLYNIHKQGALINYNYSLSALNMGVGVMGSMVGSLLGSSSSSSSSSQDENKLDKIITLAEQALSQLEDLLSNMQTDIYASLYKSYEIKSSRGFGASFSKGMKNVF